MTVARCPHTFWSRLQGAKEARSIASDEKTAGLVPPYQPWASEGNESSMSSNPSPIRKKKEPQPAYYPTTSLRLKPHPLQNLLQSAASNGKSQNTTSKPPSRGQNNNRLQLTEHHSGSGQHSSNIDISKQSMAAGIVACQ